MANARRARVVEPEVEAVPESPFEGEPPIEDPVEFTPQTELGRILQEVRKQIIASGERLLSREEIELEVAKRRTSYFDDEE